MTEIMDEIRKQPTLNIQRIYRQASSFEIFNFPELFRKAFQPENQLQINIHTNVLDQDAYEVMLNLPLNFKAISSQQNAQHKEQQANATH